MNTSNLPPVVEFAMRKFENLDCLGELYTSRVIWISKKFAEKVGYTQDELINLSPRELLDMSPEGFMNFVISTFSNTPMKQKLIKKDGTKVNATAKIHSFRYENDPYIAITDVVLEE
jgi:hypothetical protein